jgi:RNA polymerase sigma-70 factor (ECF subfamily)
VDNEGGSGGVKVAPRLSRAALTALVKKAMAGSNDAFAVLFRVFAKEIVYHVSERLNDKTRIDDAAQEVAVYLYRNIANLQSPFAFKAYLLKTIMTVCSWYNNKSKAPSEPLDDYADVLEDTKNLAPEESLEQLELSAAVSKALDRLPASQREAIQMYYFDELSYKEIAELQNVSTNTVGSNIYKAKKALKRLIEDDRANNDARERTMTDSETKRADGTTPEGLDDAQTLRGASFAPIIIAAVSERIDTVATADHVQSFLAGAGSLLAAGATTASGATGSTVTAGPANAATAASGGIITFIQTHLISVVLVGALMAIVVPGGTYLARSTSAPTPASFVETPAATSTVIQPAEYHPDARIEFGGGAGAGSGASGNAGGPEQLNPQTATLVLDSGSAAQWTITDISQNIVASGEGSQASGVFANLAPGDYVITWHAENEAGGKARISREFIVG